MGKAWQEVNQSKDSIIRSFKKSRISLDLSGSEDDDINIEGIPYYKMQSADEDLVEFHLESDDSDDDVYDNNEDDMSLKQATPLSKLEINRHFTSTRSFSAVN